MRVIIAGVPREYADAYALRLMEQGRAIPAPPEVPEIPVPVMEETKTIPQPAPKSKGKRK